MGRKFKAWQKVAILTKADFKCQCCGIEIAWENFHADHVIPFSKNGETSIVNGQALCASCNLKKGARSEAVKLAKTGT